MEVSRIVDGLLVVYWSAIMSIKGASMQATHSPAFDAAILTRVVQPERDDLTPAGAPRY